MSARFSVEARDGWHAIKDGHVPVEGEWNTPTACGYFVTAPFGFARSRKVVTCAECHAVVSS